MYTAVHADANRPEKWTAGVDWFRWKVDQLGAVRNVLARIRELQQQDVEAASSLKPWKFQGYEGLASDSIRWGKRGGYLLWESSGDRAASTMASMAPSGGYCLRCDLQTTVRFSSSVPHFGTSLIGYSQETTPIPLRSQIQRGVSTQTTGLWLGTVGRRTSPSYLRVYDKGVESKTAPPGVVWRVEVEAKNTHSRKLCQDHLSSLRDPRFCASYVASSVTRLGLRWPFSALASLPVDVKLGKKEQSTAGQLAIWLTHTVRPTIPRMLSVFTVAEILEMLNLSDVAAPIGKANALASKPKNARPRRSNLADHLPIQLPERIRPDELGDIS